MIEGKVGFRFPAGEETYEAGDAYYVPPGHTPGSQCFLLDGRLVSGDTLFLTTCGRMDLPGGSPREMFESLKGPIAGLPDSTEVFPGHQEFPDAGSLPLGEVRKNNRFLQAAVWADFMEEAG